MGEVNCRTIRDYGDYKRTMRELKDQQESGVTDDSQLQTDDSQEMTVE